MVGVNVVCFLLCSVGACAGYFVFPMVLP